QGPELDCMTRLVCRTSSSSHTVAADCGCTNIPLAAGRAQNDETNLDDGISPSARTVRRPESARTEEFW
ncbi:hypothetical protein ACWGTO_33565, partial [Mesorhizobium sp. PL10]